MTEKKIPFKRIPWRFWEKERKDPNVVVKADIEMLRSIRARYKDIPELSIHFREILKVLEAWKR